MKQRVQGLIETKFRASLIEHETMEYLYYTMLRTAILGKPITRILLF